MRYAISIGVATTVAPGMAAAISTHLARNGIVIKQARHLQHVQYSVFCILCRLSLLAGVNLVAL